MPGHPSDPASKACQPALLNGHASSTPKPDVSGNGTAAPGEPVNILDETLEEKDVRMVMSLEMNGRTMKIANLKLDRVVYEGSEIRNRWVLLKAIEDILAELRRGVVYKVTSKLPIPNDSPAPGVEAASTSPGEEKFPSDMIIHHPPPLESKW